MEVSSSKIGVGILTYKRPDYFKQVLAKIPRNEIGILAIVNDGEDNYASEQDADVVFLNKKQLGVSVSKNILLKSLIDKGCEYLFLIEDDILIKDPKVFQKYIKTANSSGIHHLCFEKIAENEKSLKYSYELPDGSKLGFYHNPQGAFMYVHANLVKKLGFFDEKYVNAFEHIDFAYNLIQSQVAPPFWYFPDVLNSEDYLTDIPGSSLDSSITNKDKYKDNWQNSANHFIQKWGLFTSQIQDKGLEDLKYFLMSLQTRYSRKKISNKEKKLSIIIPYRNRETALTHIIPSLQEYVSKQVEDYEILVVEQANDKPFNKGLMNNIGCLNSTGDYLCFHDVDLIPEFADYSYPTLPSHLSSHCSQFNYINIPDKIMGGVILFTREHFTMVNGYSNEYSGWGKEDDDLYERCLRENLTPYKHPLGKFYSIPHPHRLENPIENELHLANGQRFRSFLSSKENLHQQDGLINCESKIISISKKEHLHYTHYYINF